jgi:hypothetical protein
VTANPQNDYRQKFVGGIGPDSDLQVHDLAVGGSLSVSGDTILNGNIGIGATDPSNGRLTIKGIVEPQQGLLTFFSKSADVEYNGGSDGLFVFRDTGGKTAFIGGNVGIGTADPKFILEVAGDAAKPGGGQWTVSSDLNLKQNVKSLQGALSTLLQLRGVSFEWKEPEKQGNLTGAQMGMVAQEVEKIIPAWVGTNPDGTKNLTIRGFEALVVEAVRELNSKVDQLLQRMEIMEQKLGITTPSIPAVTEEASASETENKDESTTTSKSTRKKSKK